MLCTGYGFSLARTKLFCIFTDSLPLHAPCYLQVLHLGDYVLAPAGTWPSLDLYLALDFSHLARLALLRPPACAAQNSLGLLSAPVNAAAICFTLVVGMQVSSGREAWVRPRCARARRGLQGTCSLTGWRPQMQPLQVLANGWHATPGRFAGRA